MSLIIVIEDHFPNARMVEKLLKRADYEVILAEDGETGLTSVFENQPDLILIDLGLPDIDGQTVIGLIKQQATLDSVPIIAFTAWPPEEAHDMAKRYGCDGVITKPINTRTFTDQIKAFIDEKVASLANASDESTTDNETSPDDIEVKASKPSTAGTIVSKESNGDNSAISSTTESVSESDSASVSVVKSEQDVSVRLSDETDETSATSNDKSQIKTEE